MTMPVTADARRSEIHRIVVPPVTIKMIDCKGMPTAAARSIVHPHNELATPEAVVRSLADFVVQDEPMLPHRVHGHNAFTSSIKRGCLRKKVRFSQLNQVVTSQHNLNHTKEMN